jgi:hypothetical protein
MDELLGGTSFGKLTTKKPGIASMSPPPPALNKPGKYATELSPALRQGVVDARRSLGVHRTLD